MPKLGFTLLAEETCRFSRIPSGWDPEQGASKYRTALIMDGEQLWVSDSVVERARAAGFLRS